MPVAHLDMTEALDEISVYATIPGWDGYNAPALSADVIERSRMLAKLLPDGADIAPGADGSIGFEWVWEEGPIVELWLDVLGPEFGCTMVVHAVFRERDGKKSTWTYTIPESAAGHVAALVREAERQQNTHGRAP